MSVEDIVCYFILFYLIFNFYVLMSGFWFFFLKTDPSFQIVRKRRKVQFHLGLAPSMMGIHFACYVLISLNLLMCGRELNEAHNLATFVELNSTRGYAGKSSKVVIMHRPLGKAVVSHMDRYSLSVIVASTELAY